MVTEIKKRDGRVEPFCKKKIYDAIRKANAEVAPSEQMSDEFINDVVDQVCYEGEFQKPLDVESVQDMVETALMRIKAYAVAQKYIRYRYKHALDRARRADLMKKIGDKIQMTDIENQNANVDEISFGGRKGEADSVLMKQWALENCISKKARENHENNEIYIHDLDSYAVGSHNCLSIPFDDLLKNGFTTRQTDVRPAQSVSTAFQLVAVIFQIQSLQQFGGVSATHLDWTMVPYVRKSFIKHYIDGLKYVSNRPDEDIDCCKAWVAQHPDSMITDVYFRLPSNDVYRYAMDMTTREINQAVEGMYHNLNTLQSRSGNQLPFTSINYGTCTLPEGRMITKALLDCSIKGIGKLHRTPIFPCGIFQSAEGINRKPGDPNYDLFQLALESTSLRLYPNYANVNWSGNGGYDPEDPRTIFSTMGCRTANGWDVNGFGQIKDGRGNICPVTIIMPTLAMQAKERLSGCDYVDSRGYVAEFLNLLDQKIHEAKDMLIERYRWICSQPAASAKFMYENGLMAGYDGKTTESALKHGTLALGQLGLAETLEILTGENHTTEYGMEVAKEIEGLFKQRCAEFKQEYSLNFGVYFSPAENLCYTAMKKFREKYGVIKNVSDHDFFTNSMHIPVWEKVGVFQKIDLESQLTGYSSAGCITYVELESSIKHNLPALETVVLYAMEHDIPYFAVNVPNDTCMNCGYSDEFDIECPMCGSHNILHLRRVTGYLTNDYKTSFNKGKQQEVEMRVKHSQNGGQHELERH